MTIRFQDCVLLLIFLMPAYFCEPCENSIELSSKNYREAFRQDYKDLVEPCVYHVKFEKGTTGFFNLKRINKEDSVIVDINLFLNGETHSTEHLEDD